MNDIIDEKKEEILELVANQPGAKIDWVSKIVQIDPDVLHLKASEIGLILENNALYLQNASPSTSKVSTDSPIMDYDRVKKSQEASSHISNEKMSSTSIAASKTKLVTRDIRRKVFSIVGIVFSLSVLGTSIWMIVIGLIAIIPYWGHEYFRYIISALSGAFYMTVFGFILLLASIIAVGFFGFRFSK